MTVLWIEGQAMPIPAYRGYTTRLEEIVVAKRNVGNPLETGATGLITGVPEGALIKKRIAVKYVIEVQWRGISASDKTAIMRATSGNSFRVTFLDMDTDTIVTDRSMYRGTGQTITGYGTYDPRTKRFQRYDVTMSLIEL